jgi:hypothetical protein
VEEVPLPKFRAGLSSVFYLGFISLGAKNHDLQYAAILDITL